VIYGSSIRREALQACPWKNLSQDLKLIRRIPRTGATYLPPEKSLKFFLRRPILFLVRGTQKRRKNMEAQDFLRVINELDFILDDIDEISGQLDLTKTENGKMFRAINGIEKSKKILVELFPKIKSLDYEVREDLSAELIDS
jgi:hypothetical protein